MIIGFILTTTIAVILWAFQPSRPSSRWAGLTFFTAGAGFVNIALANATVSYLDTHAINPNWYFHFINFISEISLYSSIYVFPFCYLMFALYYSERWRPQTLRIAAILLLFPVITPMFIPVLTQPKLILSWVAMYILAASLLIIRTYVTESIQEKKQFKAVTALFFVPLTTIDLLTGYGAEVFRYPYLLELNISLAIIAFMLFVYFIIRNGLLGIRLRMERQQFDLSMEGLSSGTLKLTHALKNHISKMRIYALIIRKIADETGNSDLEVQSDRIMNNSSHMLLMMDRIEVQSHSITMNETEIEVDVTIDAVIDSFDLTQSGIRVTRDYPFAAVLRCDEVHVKEVLTNLISNAMEAIDRKSERKLTIGYYDLNRAFVIFVKDNGEGISKLDLHKVVQPFFTTKNDSHHFGMGLSYCYIVMAKHGGDIRIVSSEGIGTEIYLRFKRNRLVAI
jgi:two-component system sporulation sensor kinase B